MPYSSENLVLLRIIRHVIRDRLDIAAGMTTSAYEAWIRRIATTLSNKMSAEEKAVLHAGPPPWMTAEYVRRLAGIGDAADGT